MVLAFHVGTDPVDVLEKNNAFYRGPGGAVLNYTESTFSGQRAAMKLVASMAGQLQMSQEGGAGGWAASQRA